MTVWRKRSVRSTKVVGVFRTRIGGPETTDEIIKNALRSGRHVSVDELLTQANFPIYPLEEPKEEEVEIIDPGWYFGDKRGCEEYLAVLKEANLERPTYEHAIRLFGQHIEALIATSELWGNGVTFPHEPRVDSYSMRYLMCFWCFRNSLRVRFENDFGDGFICLPKLVAGIRRGS